MKTVDLEELTKLLSRLAAHRNINYQKVSSYVTTFLKELGLDFQQTLEKLCLLTPAFVRSNTRIHMSQNMFKGFEAYWVLADLCM